MNLNFMTLRQLVSGIGREEKYQLIKALCMEESKRTEGTDAYYAWNRVLHAVDEAHHLERERSKIVTHAETETSCI